MTARKLGSTLFGDARNHKLAEITRTRCAAAGVRNEGNIQREIAQDRAAWAPVLAESDEAALPVAAFVDLVTCRRFEGTAAEIAERRQLVAGLGGLPVYGPGTTDAARVASINAELVAKRPELNRVMMANGAGWSVPVVKHLTEIHSEQRSASSRAAKDAKAFRI